MTPPADDTTRNPQRFEMDPLQDGDRSGTDDLDEELDWVRNPQPIQEQEPVEPDWAANPLATPPPKPPAPPPDPELDPVERMRLRHARMREMERRKQATDGKKVKASRNRRSEKLRLWAFIGLGVFILGGGSYGLELQFQMFSSFFAASDRTIALANRRTVTKVEGMDEKRVVAEGEATGHSLATRLTVADQPEDPEEARASAAAAAGLDGATGQPVGITPGIVGVFDDTGSIPHDVQAVVTQVSNEQVCYQGRIARRVPSFYGLDGGFGVTYAPEDHVGPDPGPRLEFKPPRSGSGSGYYVVAFGDSPVDGFSSREAIRIDADQASVGHTLMRWMAEVADGICERPSGTASGPAATMPPPQ